MDDAACSYHPPQTSMSKNIVLCCDGTNNQFAGNHTNVIRTHKVAVRSAQQVKFYDCGVGTMPEPWDEGRLARRWSMVKGLAFGIGFMQNIEDAYRFLMINYEPGDKVYLFGFSRGAYTARALAGMLHSVGLLYPGTENLIRYAQRYWQKDHRDAANPKGQGQLLCEEFKNTLARPCPVHFIGVWDTVGSVGFINQFHTYPFTAKNPEVSHVRHAVSIDERRSFFRQNLMFKDYPAQDVKNVWFAGVHSDVGGGYPPAEEGLAKITFEWMMREAGLCGLQIDPTALQDQLNGVGAPPNLCADWHESLTGGWKLVEVIPVKRYNWTTGQTEWHVPLGEPRNVELHADKPDVFLHQAVIDRFKCRDDYRPPNIPHTDAELRDLFKNKIET
jgi:uncharacterized protein (DUF2235 family)